MELSLSFDSIASTYNSTRTGYPDEIYNLARKVGRLGSKSRILEIGAGPGIATQELVDHLGCFVDVIEPGISFCEILTSKFSTNPKISIQNCLFERFNSPHMYDAIFSATAFHWIEPKLKYIKSSDLLSKNGILVLYWNNYLLANRSINELSQVVYRKYFPNQDYSVSIYDIKERIIRERQREISESKLFRQIESKVFKRVVQFPLEKYINLLRTFSENLALDKSVSELLFKEISICIGGNSPTVEVDILTNLEIARKTK
jgi:SAM-dependent methyltransferase